LTRQRQSRSAIGFVVNKVLQLLAEARVAAADPFQHHGRMLLLLVTIVGQDGAQLVILGGVDPLVVPIHCFQLFHQRPERAVHVERRL
jgi:hypothetical protein